MGMSRGEKDACHAKMKPSFLLLECTPSSFRFLDVRGLICVFVLPPSIPQAFSLFSLAKSEKLEEATTAKVIVQSSPNTCVKSKQAKHLTNPQKRHP
jgi:hypothetical protein